MLETVAENVAPYIAPEVPLADRARIMGPGTLTDAELVSLMCGRPVANVPELRRVKEMRVPELARRLGISEVRALRVLVGLEAGRRAQQVPLAPRVRLLSPSDVAGVMGPQLSGLAREHVVALLVDRRQRLISQVTVSEGWAEGAPVDPREVFRPALAETASGLILVHNHPSGDPTPSQSDRDLTRRLRDAGQVLGCRLLDHVVVASGGHSSLAQEGLCG